MKKFLGILLFVSLMLTVSCGTAENSEKPEKTETTAAEKKETTQPQPESTAPATAEETKPENTEPTEPEKYTLSSEFGATILDGLYLSMPMEKVFLVTGENYTDQFNWGYPGADDYYRFWVDSYNKLGITKCAQINVGFDAERKLHSAYCCIGFDEEDNNICTAQEAKKYYDDLKAEFDQCYYKYKYAESDDVSGMREPICRWLYPYGIIQLECCAKDDPETGNYVTISWNGGIENILTPEELETLKSNGFYIEDLTFCEKPDCPNLSPCQVHRKHTTPNTTDGKVGDNNGDGKIDESDWMIEWKDFLNEKLKDY